MDPSFDSCRIYSFPNLDNFTQILPEHLSSYIEAPVPYIIGLYLEENEDFEFASDDVIKIFL